MKADHASRITELELTVATLVSSNLPVSSWTENYAVHERLWDHISRMGARVDSISARVERDIGAINQWEAKLAKEVESFRRLVADLRKYTEAQIGLAHRSIDLVREELNI